MKTLLDELEDKKNYSISLLGQGRCLAYAIASPCGFDDSSDVYVGCFNLTTDINSNTTILYRGTEALITINDPLQLRVGRCILFVRVPKCKLY